MLFSMKNCEGLCDFCVCGKRRRRAHATKISHNLFFKAWTADTW